MNRRFHPAFVAAACAALVSLAHAAPPTYVVSDIGTLGGNRANPAQINDRGMITGDSTRHDHDNQGVAFFQWKKKFVGLPQEQPGIATHGTGVNFAGTVSGWEGGPSGGGLRPFIWNQAGKQYLASSGYAMAINDDGVVTGTAGLSGWHAFSWRAGVMTDLGTLGGFAASSGSAINAHGDIAGWVGSDNLDSHAMAVFDGVMIDLGVFGGSAAQATGINAGRAVCGNVQFPLGGEAAFVWQAGSVQLIRGPEGTAWLEAAAIDENGVVVGEMKIPGKKEGRSMRHAFAWRDGVLTDLNDMLAPGNEGWTIETASSINNLGEIVGRGRLNGGPMRAVHLTPVK